jgi:hypothetical protein
VALSVVPLVHAPFTVRVVAFEQSSFAGAPWAFELRIEEKSIKRMKRYFFIRKIVVVIYPLNNGYQ